MHGGEGKERAGDGCVLKPVVAVTEPPEGSEGHCPELSLAVHLTANSHPVERRSRGREIPAWRVQPAVLRAEKSSKALEKALWPKAAADSGSWTAAGACRNGEARGM